MSPPEIPAMGFLKKITANLLTSRLSGLGCKSLVVPEVPGHAIGILKISLFSPM